MTGDSFPECAENKAIQFLFRLDLNSVKRLWCNAIMQIVLAFSSITVNLHSKNFVFQCMYLFCVGIKYSVLLQLLFLYSRLSAVLASNYRIISSNVDSTGPFLGCCEVEKRINNCGKFLDLDGTMLLSVLLKLL